MSGRATSSDTFGGLQPGAAQIRISISNSSSAMKKGGLLTLGWEWVIASGSSTAGSDLRMGEE